MRSLVAICLVTAGCCSKQRDHSAETKMRLANHTLNVAASTFNFCASGHSRGDFISTHVTGCRIEARLDDRPKFSIAEFNTAHLLDGAELRRHLSAMRWSLSPDGQRLQLAPYSKSFYFLPAGPGFSIAGVPSADQRSTKEIAEAGISDVSQCFHNRDLLRAVAANADRGLHQRLVEACAKAAFSPNEPPADLEAGLIEALVKGHGPIGAEGRVVELCLAARSHPCHQAALEYTFAKCDRYNCFEASLLADYGSVEELKSLRHKCTACASLVNEH